MKTFKIENVWNSTNPNNWFVESVKINGKISGGKIRRKDFTTAEAAGVQFRGIDFPEYTLFQGANIEDSQFINCDLKGASFLGANLKDCVFNGCDLRNASFGGCDLTDVKFIRCDLSGTDFRGADFRNCAELYCSNLSGAKLAGAKNIEIAHTQEGVVYQGWRFGKTLITPDGYAISGDEKKYYGN